MSATLAPLPADLSELGPDGLKEAIASREALLDDVFKLAGDEYDMTKVSAISGDSIDKTKTLRVLNGDLARLRARAEQVDPHPGHPAPKGERAQTKTNGAAYGLVEGLGASFLDQLKAQGGGSIKALDATSGGATMPGSFFDRRLRDLPQRQLFVRSLIPTMQVSSDKIAFVRQTLATFNAAAVAAGALKPTSVVTAAREEAPIRVIAHISEAMDRSMLSDYDALTAFIDSQMRLGVLLAEESQILNGTGVAPQLTGILNTSGIQTQAKGADPTPDAVMKGVTKIRNQFFEPDAVVFHPNDWEQVALLRTADGIYIWGSPADETEPRIWDKRVVVTPVIAEGTALVGAFGNAAQVYERESVRLSFAETGLGDSAGQELWSRNQVRWRAESRIGLAVIRPAAFCTITGV